MLQGEQKFLMHELPGQGRGNGDAPRPLVSVLTAQTPQGAFQNPAAWQHPQETLN